MTNVLLITGDPIGAKMAGPAIRSWNMALALSAEHTVTLMTTTNLEPRDAPFALERVRPGEDARFAELERAADVILFQGHARDQFAALQTTTKIVICDIYDPMQLEMLEQGREEPRGTWELMVTRAARALNSQLAAGDFFLCASDRQRLFYLGQLATLGRLSPATYENDPHLVNLLSIVPFGLDATPPIHEKQVLKGVRPGIGPDDRVVIWGGGIYSWFDPHTLIRAIAALAKRRPQAKLFFLGTKHPGVDEMEIVASSRRLAAELGATDSSVFFNDSWVDFADRQNYLLEASAGASTHQLHVETEFSFRTRILDYLWADLPMVVTEGDSMADLVARESLGIVVQANDVDALEAALEKVLFDERFAKTARANVRRVAADFTWDRVLEPLVGFVRDPHHAADRPGGVATGVARELATTAGRSRPTHGPRHDIAMAWHYLRNSGPLTVLSKVRRRLGRNH
ncbi:MAG TPA: glycosyltransferase family 4 protein [Galbitalea sp.]|nr:glycosyltransferase family 4 protein [Galbitalea sp.]